jgi:uncharacterized protein (DUF58 family)
VIRRPGALGLAFLTVLGWACFLGVLSGRAELFLAAVPLLLALLSARLDVGPRDYVLSHELSSSRVFTGDRVTVTVTLTAHRPIPLVEVVEELPPLVERAAGRNHAVFTLTAGQQVRWTYELACPTRRRFTLGRLHLRFSDRSGLWVGETEHFAPSRLLVYPRSRPLRRVPRPRRTQTSSGNYVSPAFGEGLEPGDIRPFVPGDRMKHVNWRASLRSDRLHVTQYHQERNADVVLMLDTLAEVGPAAATSLDVSAEAASALTAAYLARRDRVGLIEYGGILRWLAPGSGRRQYVRILDALLDAEVVFTYVPKDLDLIPRRVLPPQALVIALSPLLDSRFVTALVDLAGRGIDLVVLTVSPTTLTRRAIEADAVDDLACRLWQLERLGLLDDLRRRGLTIREWDPAGPLDAVLAGCERRPRRAALVG